MRRRAREQKKLAALSLFTATLMKINWGMKALKAAAPIASDFLPGKTSRAMRYVRRTVPVPNRRDTILAICTAKAVPR